MTVQQLYDYAKKHNAVDYEIYGTSISCGPHFDRVKVNKENKSLSALSIDSSSEGLKFHSDSYFGSRIISTAFKCAL